MNNAVIMDWPDCKFWIFTFPIGQLARLLQAAAHGRHATCHAPAVQLRSAAALDGLESSTPQQGSASGCGATIGSFTTDHRFPRCAVLSIRAPQAAAAPFCRCNAWPSATMLRLEARFFAPNVRCVWPCPRPGCQNETWPSALLRHTQQREQTCRGENVSQHAKKSCQQRKAEVALT